jgi:hypothetical protein
LETVRLPESLLLLLPDEPAFLDDDPDVLAVAPFWLCAGLDEDLAETSGADLRETDAL